MRGSATGSPSRPPLVVGYVLKMFPRFSETFILNEILQLERLGVSLIVFSIKAPDESQCQPFARHIRAPVRVIPGVSRHSLVMHLACHLRCLKRDPPRYIRTLTFACGRRSLAAWRKFFAAPYIVCEARRFGVEHFHAHFASGPARQAKLASMLSGIPYSFTAHAKDLFWKGHQHGKNNKLKKRIRLASFVVTISDYNRRFIETLGFKIPRRRVATVYNGLDLSRWPYLRPEGRPCVVVKDQPAFILAVGRLVRKKGFDDLITACGILKSEGVALRCVIAGEGPELARLKEHAEKAGVSDAVEFPGPVAQDRLVGRLYSRAHVLVQPSVQAGDGDYDGIPTVILEALAVGLPVVAASISGIGEAVVGGKTGLLVPSGHPAALARAIRRVLEDDLLACRLATGGRKMVESRFNLRQNAKVLLHLMQMSARGSRRWSEQKMRDKMGDDSVQGIVAEEGTYEISAAG